EERGLFHLEAGAARLVRDIVAETHHEAISVRPRTFDLCAVDLVVCHPLLALLGDRLESAQFGGRPGHRRGFDAHHIGREQRLERDVVLMSLAKLDVLVGNLGRGHEALLDEMAYRGRSEPRRQPRGRGAKTVPDARLSGSERLPASAYVPAGASSKALAQGAMISRTTRARIS